MLDKNMKRFIEVFSKCRVDWNLEIKIFFCEKVIWELDIILPTTYRLIWQSSFNLSDSDTRMKAVFNTLRHRKLGTYKWNHAQRWVKLANPGRWVSFWKIHFLDNMNQLGFWFVSINWYSRHWQIYSQVIGLLISNQIKVIKQNNNYTTQPAYQNERKTH